MHNIPIILMKNLQHIYDHIEQEKLCYACNSPLIINQVDTYFHCNKYCTEIYIYENLHTKQVKSLYILNFFINQNSSIATNYNTKSTIDLSSFKSKSLDTLTSFIQKYLTFQ